MSQVQERAMARIARKRELETRLASALSALSGPRLANEAGLRTNAGDARGRLESFIRQHGNGAESAVPEGRRADLADLKRRYEEASQKYNAVKDERGRLLTERDRLQAELKALSNTAELHEIEEQKKKVEQAEATVTALSQAIEEQRVIIQANQAPSLNELSRQRQDLLADAATGKNVARKLEVLDKEIKDAEQRREQCAKLAKDAEQAIAGLERKRADAEKLAGEARQDLADVVVFYLKAEIEVAARDYAEAAAQLAEKYRRFAALDALIMASSGGREDTIISGEYRHFSIPGITRDSDPLFAPKEEDSAAWVAAERERQAGAGVPM